MYRSLFFIVFVLLSVFYSVAQVFDIVVDPNGDGNYTTISEALDEIPDNSSERTLVFIKNGLYKEKLWLTSVKKNVSLIGEDVDSVIIDWDDYQGRVVNGNTISGADSYTFLAEGEDLYMENITIKNSAGQVGQAVAIRTIGDRQAFKNCNFLGNQDTYYAHKNRQYNYKCTVEGTTDYIYGDATSVFDSCTIRSVPGGSYISAPADAKLITHFTTGDFYHGLLFRYCNVTAAEGVSDHSVYLGRPWQPNSSSVFIECVLENHIKPEGWSTWSDDNHLSSFFAEFKDKMPDGNLVDTTQRVSWSYQLKESALNRYALKFFLHNSDNLQEYWNPVPIITPLYNPQNVELSQNQLLWDNVENAIGYVIYYKDRAVGFSETTAFSVSSGIGDVTDFKVVSVSTNGALSDGSVSINNALNEVSNDKLIYSFKNKIFEIQHSANIDVFDLNGRKLLSEKKIKVLNFSGFPTGIYVLKISGSIGNVRTLKLWND